VNRNRCTIIPRGWPCPSTGHGCVNDHVWSCRLFHQLSPVVTALRAIHPGQGKDGGEQSVFPTEVGPVAMGPVTGAGTVRFANKCSRPVDAPTAVSTALWATTEDENERVIPLRPGTQPPTPMIRSPSRRTDRSRRLIQPVADVLFQSSVDAPRGHPEG